MTSADFSGKSKDETIEYLLQKNNAMEQEIAKLSQSLAESKEIIEKFKRMIFASKSEKKHVGYDNPQQLTLADLFNEAELETNPNVQEPTQETVVEGYHRVKAGSKKKKASYEELYDKLPSRDMLCSLAEEDKICPKCGSLMDRVGWEYVRTELEIIPPQIRLVKIYQERVRCKECFDMTGSASFALAPVPSPLMEHSIASPTTVAYVMYQKYVNSMPLYRQEQEWNQLGAPIRRATLANWCIYCGMTYMKPVYEAMKKHLLERITTCADETPCQVLKEDGRTAQQKSYMWIHCTSNLDGLPPIMLYEYNPSRAGAVPQSFYSSFQGKYFLADGYQGYNHLPEGVLRCGCLAHFRRKFYEAIPSADRKKGKSSSPAVKIVNLCSKLFEIERSFTDLTPEERKIKRNESREHEIWKEIWESLDLISASKNSLLGKAVTYAQNQKPYMETYFLDGSIPISNNFTESCGARPYAVGRKNFYFHDTPDGAEASAIIYSLAQTAKINNLSVFKYLQAVLLYMPDYINEPEGIEELMPWSDRMKEICAINDKPTIEGKS